MAVVRVPLCSFANERVRLFVTFNDVTQVVSQIDVENDSTGDSQDGQGNQQDALFHIPITGGFQTHRLSGTNNKDVSAAGYKRPKHGPGGINGPGIGAAWPS